VADSFETGGKVCKVLDVDEKLGLVFGWGIICTKRDAETQKREPYFDLDDPPDHIPAESMLEAATDFQLNSQLTDEMHDEVPDGRVAFSFPLTEGIAKAYGIECDTEGWMVAAKPSPEVFAKFADGTYTGFSIGGHRVEDVDAAEVLAS
jgi:hypothetical protein